MHKTVVQGIPEPVEFSFEGRKFVQYGISPVKLAELQVKGRKEPEGTKRNPIIKNGKRYVYNPQGKLVLLEHFDPETMERFTLTKDAKLSSDSIERMNEFSSKQVVLDDECPEVPDELVAAILQKAREQRK